MSQETIALVTLLIVVICLLSRKVSVAVTLVTATCVMVLTGIINFQTAFSAFASSTVWMMISLMVIGEAMNRTGITMEISRKLQMLMHVNERLFISIIYITAGIASWFLNALIVVILMMQIADYVSVATNGRICRKYTYFPIAMGASLGSVCTSIGSSAMMNVSTQLEASAFGRSFHLLEPLPIGLPVFLSGLLFYLTIGVWLQHIAFNFKEELPVTSAASDNPAFNQTDMPLLKRIITYCVLAGTILLIAFEATDTGVICVLAIMILILTGCLKEKEAYESIDWKICLCVVGSIGLGKGIMESGAGTMVADIILNHCGSLRNSPFTMCVIILIFSTVLSNFMANNSAAAIIVPIAFSVAQEMGGTELLLPFAIACAIGVNASVATPICRTAVTMTIRIGYDFRNMAIVGFTLNAIACIVAAVALYIVYF